MTLHTHGKRLPLHLPYLYLHPLNSSKHNAKIGRLLYLANSEGTSHGYSRWVSKFQRCLITNKRRTLCKANPISFFKHLTGMGCGPIYSLLRNGLYTYRMSVLNVVPFDKFLNMPYSFIMHKNNY